MMGRNLPICDRQALARGLACCDAVHVVAKPSGRFALWVPNLADGLGPILRPNAKVLSAVFSGDACALALHRLEADPQIVPVDGSQVVLINRVDEHSQLALASRLKAVLSDAKGQLARPQVLAMLAYATGFHYDPVTQQATYSPNAGIRADLYNMPLIDFARRYAAVDEADLKERGGGYYIKRALPARLAFIRGAFAVALPEGTGAGVQTFEQGAYLVVPELNGLMPSLVDPGDIDVTYMLPHGQPVASACVPTYAPADLTGSC